MGEGAQRREVSYRSACTECARRKQRVTNPKLGHFQNGRLLCIHAENAKHIPSATVSGHAADVRNARWPTNVVSRTPTSQLQTGLPWIGRERIVPTTKPARTQETNSTLKAQEVMILTLWVICLPILFLI